MGISLRPEHLKRYTQIARLLLKYGRSDLVRQAGLEDVLEEDLDDSLTMTPETGELAEELAKDLERMGPTFIKLGQLLSTRVDLIPLSYTEALSRLQDKVEPFPFSEVERIIESELEVRLSKAFLEFDPEPLAAASLGQVHRAKLRSGYPVAVKVQRPGIRDQVIDDFEALSEIAGFLDRHTEVGRRYEFHGMLMEFRRTLMRELDYRQEANNLATLRDNLAQFDGIVVPEPVDDYTTSRVLTMDYVRGRKITSIGPLTRLHMDGERLAEQLFEAYLKQILVDGFFHADPHPGNVFLTEDRKVALLDVGMVGRVTPELQDQLLRLLLTISEARGEEAADLLIHMGERRVDFDEDTFKRQIAQMVVQHHDATTRELQVGRLLVEVTRVAGENGLRVPPQLTMLGKTLLNLDQVGRELDPDFEPNASVRRNAGELSRQRLLRNLSPSNVLSNVLEMNEFVQRLPERLNRALDVVTDHGLEVRIRVINESVLMDGMQKVANRIAMGAILGALIIGAAMLMQVETSFRIFGYPGLAMILFLVAAIGGFLMVLNIVLHDHRGPR